MSRRNRIPAYRLHKQSGQAIVTLSDGFSRRRDILLGRYGSSESRKEYARVLTEWESNSRRLPQPVAGVGHHRQRTAPGLLEARPRTTTAVATNSCSAPCRRS